MSERTLTKIKIQVAKPDTSVLERARVILYNDDWHSFDDVIEQVVLAINCSAKRAKEIAWTVHNQGECEVFKGNLENCLEVSSVLEDIDLKTEIRF